MVVKVGVVMVVVRTKLDNTRICPGMTFLHLILGGPCLGHDPHGPAHECRAPINLPQTLAVSTARIDLRICIPPELRRRAADSKLTSELAHRL